MVVDYQAHWYPRSYLDSILGRKGYPRTERADDGGYVFEFDDQPLGNRWLVHPHYCDFDLQLANMDANGIDIAVLSPNLVGEVTRLDRAEARETVELLNEETARTQRQHPDRVVGLAMLPMQNAEDAIEVLERAIGDLELRGVCIISHIAGELIASDETRPIYQRVEQLGVPIFLHPSNRSMAFGLVQGGGRVTEVGLSWMFETSAAAMSLIYTGTLDACPRLTVVHPHAGGVLPFIVGRIASVQALHRVGTDRSIEEYLRSQFYVDSASLTPGALSLTASCYGRERILYASDYPWTDRERGLQFLADHVDPTLADEVLHQNGLPTLRLPDAHVG